MRADLEAAELAERKRADDAQAESARKSVEMLPDVEAALEALRVRRSESEAALRAVGESSPMNDLIGARLSSEQRSRLASIKLAWCSSTGELLVGKPGSFLARRRTRKENRAFEAALREWENRSVFGWTITPEFSLAASLVLIPLQGEPDVYLRDRNRPFEPIPMNSYAATGATSWTYRSRGEVYSGSDSPAHTFSALIETIAFHLASLDNPH